MSEESASDLKSKADRKRILLYISGLGMSMGAELIAATLVALYLGRYLDAKWNSGSYATLACVILFIGASLIHIFFILMHMQKKLDALKENKKERL